MDHKPALQLVEKSRWHEQDIKTDVIRAFSEGAPAMEIDVRADISGRLYVHHADKLPNGLLLSRSHAEQLGDVPLLSDILSVLAEFPSAHLVIELKTMGSIAEQPEVMSRLVCLLNKEHVINRVSIASLSPSLLLAAHATMPTLPLILNAGWTPCISYPCGRFGKNIAKRLESGRGWFTLGTHKSFVVIASGRGALRYPMEGGADGCGHTNLYALTQFPEQLIEVLREQTEAGYPYGGAASVANSTASSSFLRKLKLNKWAYQVSNRAIQTVHDLGMNAQTTTWGTINKETTIQGWQPFAQIQQMIADGLSDGDVVYTRGSGQLVTEYGRLES